MRIVDRMRINPLAVFLLICIATRVSLTWDIPSTFRLLDVDDLLYAVQADSIVSGEWLGPYDQKTFVKSAGYSIFLAGVIKSGIPLRQAQEGFWAFAGLLLVWSLRRLGVPRHVAGVVFFFCYFNPSAFTRVYNRILREGIYSSETLIAVALLIALFPRAALWKRILLAGGLGLAVAALWHTREEGVWILPPFAGAAVGLWWIERRRASSAGKGALVVAGLALVAAAFPVAGWHQLRGMNERRYGTPVTLEVKDPDFQAALGAIMRVKPERRFRYEPIAPETLEKLYAVSPALRSLRPMIDSPRYRSGWMMGENGGRVINALSFLIRDAAAGLGHHRTPADAKAFYRRIAEEINGACDRDEIPADDRRDSVYPAFGSDRWNDFAASLRRTLSDLWELRLDRVRDKPPLPVIDVSPTQHERCLRVVGEEATPDLAGFLVRSEMLYRIGQLTRKALPWLAIAAALGLLIQLAAVPKRGLTPLLLAGLVLVALFVSRAAGVALIETLLFSTGSSYLLAAFPLFAAAAVLPIWGGASVFFRSPLEARAMSPRAALTWGLVFIAVSGAGLYLLHREVGGGPRIVPTTDFTMSDPSGLGLIVVRDGFEIAPDPAGPLAASAESPASILRLHCKRRIRPRAEDLVIAGSAEGPEPARVRVVVRGRGRSWSGVKRADFEVASGERFSWRVPLAARRIEEILITRVSNPQTVLRLDEVRTEPTR